MTNSQRLQEIKEQFQELLQEAKSIVRANVTGFAYERAKAYWINPIKTCLEAQGMGQGSMEETIGILEMDEEIELEELDDEDVIELLEQIALEVRGEVRYNYSGRGMFGKNCVGITCPDSIRCIEEATKRGFSCACVDNMGMDAIVYWPHVASPRMEEKIK